MNTHIIVDNIIDEIIKENKLYRFINELANMKYTNIEKNILTDDLERESKLVNIIENLEGKNIKIDEKNARNKLDKILDKIDECNLKKKWNRLTIEQKINRINDFFINLPEKSINLTEIKEKIISIIPTELKSKNDVVYENGVLKKILILTYNPTNNTHFVFEKKTKKPKLKKEKLIKKILKKKSKKNDSDSESNLDSESDVDSDCEEINNFQE
jgi:hypothetical protein